MLLAITLHEAAHGWIAYQLGDPTAKQLGRLTANPMKHIDRFGTIILPLSLIVLRMITGFGILIGYAKPVPVDIRNFKQPLLDMALVALAGPGANLLMALGWAVFIKLNLLLFGESPFVQHFVLMGDIGIFINLLLIVINMCPIPPLDGGRVLMGVLPPNIALIFSRIEPFGFFILVFLLIMTPLGAVLIRMLIYYQVLIMRVFDLQFVSIIFRLFGH